MAQRSILLAWELVSLEPLFVTTLTSYTVISNPVATFWTCVEMLKWLGESDAGDLLLEAAETVCENGVMTRDLGGTATSAEVTNAVCAEIKHRLSKKSK
jgi:isocitrate dehydrogenase